ncbi:MAG: ammonia-forming cytochrome c nitrite reductase subunit c552 [Anaerococcus sp.]|nr:ammonia-forming cytochrome c nitrite reductase subunit c552 [Anaerococcus sp.]
MKKNIGKLFALTALAFLISGCSSQGEIKRADDWKELYPDVYYTYQANADMSETKFGGSVPVDYLEEHPNLNSFYEGYGFAIQYDRARGHTYALEDIINTQRPKPGASCLQCKTADFVVALEKEGVDLNAMDFDEFVAENEGMSTISCYDCHMNDPGVIQITRSHTQKAIDEGQIPANTSLESLACGQCHVEYYQDSETKEVFMPVENGFETDDMLAYYEEVGHSDWTHPQTEANLLKAQHPELETFSGSVHEGVGLSCIDCHMPEVSGEDGDMVKSHHWTSPLKNKEGLQNSCLKCHSNLEEDELISWVEDVQGGVYDRTNEVSDKLKDFIDQLADHIEKDDLSQEDKESLQEIHRQAQFKWDFVFVENSEGFHNSSKAHKNLDEAEALIDSGLEILSKY